MIPKIYHASIIAAMCKLYIIYIIDWFLSWRIFSDKTPPPADLDAARSGAAIGIGDGGTAVGGRRGVAPGGPSRSDCKLKASEQWLDT